MVFSSRFGSSRSNEIDQFRSILRTLQMVLFRFFAGKGEDKRICIVEF